MTVRRAVVAVALLCVAADVEWTPFECDFSKPVPVAGSRPISTLHPWRRGASFGVVIGHGGDLVAQGIGVAGFGAQGVDAGSYTLAFDAHYAQSQKFEVAPLGGAPALLVLEARESPTWVTVRETAARTRPRVGQRDLPWSSSLTRLPMTTDGDPEPVWTGAEALLCGTPRTGGLDVSVAPDGRQLIAAGFRQSRSLDDGCDATTSILAAPYVPPPTGNLPAGRTGRAASLGTREGAPLPAGAQPSCPVPVVRFDRDTAHGNASIGLFAGPPGGEVAPVGRVTVSGATAGPSVVELHDLDGDGRVDLFFSFDALAWGVLSDVLSTSVDVPCLADLPAQGSFCVPHTGGGTALTVDVRSHEAGSDAIFAAGFIASHDPAAAPDESRWFLHTLTWRGGWGLARLGLTAGPSYATPRFSAGAPGGHDWIALSEVDLEEMRSRVAFIPFGAENGRLCPSRTGLVGDLALRPGPGAPAAMASAGGDGWRLVHLPARPLPGILAVQTGDCTNEGAPEVPPEDVLVFVDEPTLAVRGQPAVCVRYESRDSDHFEVATSLIGAQYLGVSLPNDPSGR